MSDSNRVSDEARERALKLEKSMDFGWDSSELSAVREAFEECIIAAERRGYDRAFKGG
jgi:hypothetical protein